MGDMTSLDLHTDVVTLTEQLIDIESVSGNERAIADAVETGLRALPHLTVSRFGNTLVARTEQGHGERVVVAGHLDTVPVNDNLPARRDDELLHGLGACDMKGGVAVALRIAATMPETNRDLTFLFYDCEEVEAERNGLKLLGDSPSCCRPTSRSSWSPPTRWWRRAARARCASTSPPTASAPTRHGPGGA
jgi:succinyl-diaminopimelate desuccinylase